MCELIIAADLQRLLDAARAKREARAERTPTVRAIPHAAGRPLLTPAPAPGIVPVADPSSAAGAGTVLEMHG